MSDHPSRIESRRRIHHVVIYGRLGLVGRVVRPTKWNSRGTSMLYSIFEACAVDLIPCSELQEASKCNCLTGKKERSQHLGDRPNIIYITNCLQAILHRTTLYSGLSYRTSYNLYLSMSIKQFFLAATLACTILARNEAIPISCSGPLDTDCCYNNDQQVCSFKILGVELTGKCASGGGEVSLSVPKMAALSPP